MAKVEASVILYAVDLDDLRAWIGSKDEARFREAWSVIREDEDADWEPEELEVLQRLLRRVVFEGKLYEGLQEEERYYLTQVLIDLFDEYGDADALSEDLPFALLLQVVEGLPRGSEAAKMAAWLVRGRELGGDGLLWQKGPVEDVLSFIGYLTREEAPKFVQVLDEASKRLQKRPSGLFKQLRNAAEECARAELDLVSFVG